MPILGILASSTPAAAGDYESIATVTVGSGGASNIDFTSIPTADYAHLQIRYIARNPSSYANVSIQVGNGSLDTGSNYFWHYLQGTGSTAVAGNASVAQTSGLIGAIINTSNVFGGAVIDILDYANTNKFKTFRSLSGYDDNSSGNLLYWSALWRSTSAINTIRLSASNGFAQYSHFALYGIKAA